MANFNILIASEIHYNYVDSIIELIAESAKARGTGIAQRSADYILQKIKEGKAVIALSENDDLAGFCYMETWANKKFVANSGLVIAPQFRNNGLAKKVKKKAFELSLEKYPNAKLFGLTTSLAVMKINSDLGYQPVTFSELTEDEKFWEGCQSCVNYDILTRTNKKHCLCTGMLYDSNARNNVKKKKFRDYKDKYKRWLKIKQDLLFKRFRKEQVERSGDE